MIPDEEAGSMNISLFRARMCALNVVLAVIRVGRMPFGVSHQFSLTTYRAQSARGTYTAPPLCCTTQQLCSRVLSLAGSHLGIHAKKLQLFLCQTHPDETFATDMVSAVLRTWPRVCSGLHKHSAPYIKKFKKFAPYIKL